MTIQIIPLATAQKIRQHIQTLLALPDSENQPKTRTTNAVDELPEPQSLDELGDLFNVASGSDIEIPMPNTEGRWFLSVVNPGTALNKLPGLQLKADWRLVTYLYRTESHGFGQIWAVPENQSTTADLELALTDAGSETVPPRPLGALDQVMDAVEGDRTPPSFFMASLFQRELAEFGRWGKACQWVHHRLIDSPPTKAQWKWQTEQPKDFSPKVRILPDGKAAVEFFTCRTTAPVAIFRHVDQYLISGYTCKSADKAIATPIRPSPKS